MIYLIHFSLFLKHLLPPTWRKTWQYTLVHTLLFPLKERLEEFIHTRIRDVTTIQSNMQVFALRSALSTIVGKSVYIEHQVPFTFHVRVPADTSERARRKIASYINKYKLAGTSAEIVNI